MQHFHFTLSLSLTGTAQCAAPRLPIEIQKKKSLEVADNNKRKKCLQTRVQKCGYVSHCASLVRVRPTIVSDAEYDDGRARAGDDEKGVRIEIDGRWFADLHLPPPPLGCRGRTVVGPALTDNASVAEVVWNGRKSSVALCVSRTVTQPERRVGRGCDGRQCRILSDRQHALTSRLTPAAQLREIIIIRVFYY